MGFFDDIVSGVSNVAKKTVKGIKSGGGKLVKGAKRNVFNKGFGKGFYEGYENCWKSLTGSSENNRGE